MIVTRQNPHGGPSLKTFPLKEDPATGILVYQLGYTSIKCTCGKTTYDDVSMRTVDAREVVDKFGRTLDEYDSVLYRLKKKYKEPLRNRIIKFLGGKVD